MSTESSKHKQEESSLPEEPANKKLKQLMAEAQPKYSTKITLTDEEAHIFNTLLDVVKTSGCGSVLRAAGGWVRDKVCINHYVADNIAIIFYKIYYSYKFIYMLWYQRQFLSLLKLNQLMGDPRVGDLDIALDNMMGKDFAEKVNEYPKIDYNI